MANNVAMNLTKLAAARLGPRPHGIRMHLLFLAFSILAVMVTSLLARTKIVHRWVLTSQPMLKFRKILVIAVLENYLIRQEFEDEMERLLAQSNIEGIRSHMVLPPRNEMETIGPTSTRIRLPCICRSRGRLNGGWCDLTQRGRPLCRKQ